jgi:hypothetical protein
MPYLNSGLQAKAAGPVEDYHVDTPVAEYDLVGARRTVQKPYHFLENLHKAI